LIPYPSPCWVKCLSRPDHIFRHPKQHWHQFILTRHHEHRPLTSDYNPALVLHERNDAPSIRRHGLSRYCSVLHPSSSICCLMKSSCVISTFLFTASIELRRGKR